VIPLNEIVRRMIELRRESGRQMTLLAACPNSSAVLKAGVRVAARHNLPMLFAATLNQVDRDGGYTGWTAAQFVDEMRSQAAACGWDGPLYPCLDHGGPWLKDRHTTDKLSFHEAMSELKQSLAACLSAGYQLLHIDPTVDRTLFEGAPVPIELVVQRTLELIQYAESVRRQAGLPAVSYEVGTEEVHGGLVDMDNFAHFVAALHQGLAERDLLGVWPCFIVGKVGTDLHTTYFDPHAAEQLASVATPLGSLIKGHYTDWVENPELYPASGMGGANVGPEFTVAEFEALSELCGKEDELGPSRFLEALEDAVYRSGRWQKWLLPGERGMLFKDISSVRRAWLVQTGARYVWTDPAVVAARRSLYANVSAVVADPDGYVVESIVRVMEKYVRAFNLQNANDALMADWAD
jgi:D-tagatose-1,6-bisphosphate aldolase subunit GatZ/KbaZ